MEDKTSYNFCKMPLTSEYRNRITTNKKNIKNAGYIGRLRINKFWRQIVFSDFSWKFVKLSPETFSNTVFSMSSKNV